LSLTKSDSNFRALTLLLFGLTFGIYYFVWSCSYIWDDDFYVQKHQQIEEAGGLGKIWNPWSNNVEIHPVTKQYYPVTYSSLYLEESLMGQEPWHFHVFNVLLHAIAAFLLWRILVLLEVKGAWWAAMVFALHPVCVESVAWITERKNVLAGVFFFGAIYVFLKKPVQSKWFFLVLLFYVLSMLSKSITAPLPGVLMLLLWWRRPEEKRASYLLLVPLFMLGAGLGYLSVWMEATAAGAGQPSVWDPTLMERFLLMGRTPVFYIQKILWPAENIFFYPRWNLNAGEILQYIYPLITLSLLGFFAWGCKRFGRGPLVAYLIFLGMILPASGLFNVYPFKFSFVADHFQYLACPAIIVLVISASFQFLEKHQLIAFRLYCFSFILFLLMLRTGTETHKYENLETLWVDTTLKNSGSWAAYEELGNYYYDNNQPQKAVNAYSEAAANLKNTDNLAFLMLGKLSERNRKFIPAVDYYKRYLSLHENDSSTMGKIANCLASSQQNEEAQKYYEMAIKTSPRSPVHHLNFGYFQTEKKDYGAAVDEYVIAMALTIKSLESDDTVKVDLALVLSFLKRQLERMPEAAGSQKKRLDDELDQFKIKKVVRELTGDLR
jgi:tetratricopeptide (TPR) repeat protein